MDRVQEHKIQNKNTYITFVARVLSCPVSQFTPYYTQTTLGSVGKCVMTSPKSCADVGRKERFGTQPADARASLSARRARRHFYSLVSVFIAVFFQRPAYLLCVRLPPSRIKKKKRWKTPKYGKVFTANMMHRREAPWLPTSHFR